MPTILNQIKTKMEVDIEENIFDELLLLNINSSIGYLKQNSIPVDYIEMDSESSVWTDLKSEDINIVIDWIYRDIIPEFDRDILSSSTTVEFLKEKNTQILYQLKSTYDTLENKKWSPTDTVLY